MKDINDFDILVLPGLYNSGPKHWQSNWENIFPNMTRVEQDNWDSPDYLAWATQLQVAVNNCDRPILLIGKGLGAILIALWANEAQKKIAGALLVAPTDIEKPSRITVTGFDKIPTGKLKFPSLILASNNDPRVEIMRARKFAELWGSEFVSVGNLGHIGSREDLGNWPQGLVYLGQLIGLVA